MLHWLAQGAGVAPVGVALLDILLTVLYARIGTACPTEAGTRPYGSDSRGRPRRR